MAKDNFLEKVTFNPLLRNVVKWSDILKILQQMLQDF